MKSVRFYEEVRGKGEGWEYSIGTVIAVFPEQWTPGHWTGVPLYRGVHRESALKDRHGDPNESVCAGEVSRLYLESECRRVSEARAREVHPRLFEYLGNSMGMV